MRPLLLILALAGTWLAAAQPATLDLQVKGKPLLVALEQIAEQCRASLAVDADCSQRLAQDFTLVVEQAAWADVADLLHSSHQLALTLDGSILRVADAEKAWRAGLVLRFYDLRPLMQGMTRYPAPKLELPEPGAMDACLPPGIAAAEPPQLASFMELIQRLIEPQSWGRSGVSIADHRGDLAIIHTVEVHARIQRLLEEWERVAARQVVTRIWRLEPGAAADEAVMTAERWQSQIAGQRPIASFVTPEGHPNHHFSGIQRAIVSDVDAVQAILDPIVTVISEGLVVECHPTVVVDGVLATIRVGASRSQQSVASTLTDDAGAPIATLDTPDLAIDRSRDARLVPFGGGTVFSFGERVYGVSFEVLQYHQGKPGEPRPTVPTGP